MADSSEPMPIYEGRNARPWTARPDWIAFAPISPTARELYTVLAGHKNQGRGDQTVWPSRDVLAEILGYSQGRKIDRFLDELIGIDAIARIATRSHGGMRAKNAYVVHADPPDGWTYPVSYGEFYARRRQQQEAESEKSQVAPVVPTQAPRAESEKSQVAPVVPTQALPEVPTQALPEVPTRALEPDEGEPDEFQPTSAQERAEAGWLEGQDNEGEDATSSPAKDSQPWGSSETSSDPDGVRLLRSLPRGVGQALTGSAVSGWSHVIGEALQSGMSEQVITDKLTSGLPDDDREKRVRIVVGRRLPDLQATIAEPVQHQQTSPSEAAHAQVDRMAGRGEHGAREAAGKLGEHWDPEQHRGEVGAREWMLEILPELSREFVEQRREALVRVLTSGNAA